MNENDFFSIFINLTNNCNFNCSYCYEKNNTRYNQITLQSSNKIVNFLIKNKEKLLKIKNKKYIRIHFFGGEPTLNFKSLLNIYNSLYKDLDYYFSIITNGYRISNILKNIDNNSRNHIQISYDGIESQQEKRINKNDIFSYKKVRNNIIILLNENYNVSIKSVITPDNFKYLSSNYLDIKNIFNSCNKNGSYFPTIDYYISYDDNHINDLKTELIKISKFELEELKKNNKPFLHWFNKNNNQYCSAGKNVFGIDTNLDIVPCEGCFNLNTKEHVICNLIDNNIFDKLKQLEEKTKIIEDNNCQTCKTDTCYKCNIIKYLNSNKETYSEKWNDYSNQKELCNYYKLIDKIKKAVYYIFLKEDFT